MPCKIPLKSILHVLKFSHEMPQNLLVQSSIMPLKVVLLSKLCPATEYRDSLFYLKLLKCHGEFLESVY